MELVDGNSLRPYRLWTDDKSYYEIEHTNPYEIPHIDFTWQGLVSRIAGTETSYNKDRADVYLLMDLGI